MHTQVHMQGFSYWGGGGGGASLPPPPPPQTLNLPLVYIKPMHTAVILTPALQSEIYKSLLPFSFPSFFSPPSIPLLAPSPFSFSLKCFPITKLIGLADNVKWIIAAETVFCGFVQEVWLCLGWLLPNS